MDAARISYNIDGAAQATGYSADVIRRAIRAGEIPTRYPEIDGRKLSRPVILAADLTAWLTGTRAS